MVLQTRLGLDARRVWRSLERHLAGFCQLLGDSWPLLDVSWASLGQFLGPLGCLLAALGSFRAAFWFAGASQASILEGCTEQKICTFGARFHEETEFEIKIV